MKPGRVAKSQLPNRRQFTSPLLTTVITTSGGTCRVCSGAIAHGEEVRFRAWGIEIAHVACGWFREGEGLEPTEKRKPGSFSTYYEWRCPACGLDAAKPRKPLERDDRRCGRCRPPRELACGVEVETISTVFVGRVRKEPYTRAVVRSLTEERVLVKFLDTNRHAWLPRGVLVPI